MRPSILLVDDRASTRTALKQALRGPQYEVVEAEDGVSALRLALEYRPALVLLDVQLPDTSARELARDLRELLGATPIIGISGFLNQAAVVAAPDSPFATVLVKPVQAGDLAEIIRAYLPSPSARPSGAGERVLVVDDDPMQRRLLELWLTSAGYRTQAVASATGALELLLEQHFDAVVSDVLMPELDGFELCVAIRKQLEAQMPVVLISGAYEQPEDHVLAERVGASSMVSRSSGRTGLLEALARGLARELPESQDGENVREEHRRRMLSLLERQTHKSALLAKRAQLLSAQLSVLANFAEGLARRKSSAAVLEDVLSSSLDMAGISQGAVYFHGPGRSAVLQHNIGFAPAEIDALTVVLNRELASARPGALDKGLLEFADPCAARGLVTAPLAWAEYEFGSLVLCAPSSEVLRDDALAFARMLGAQLGQALAVNKAFERVSESEERFRVVIDSLGELVFTLDREQRCVGVFGTPHAQGLTPEDVLGNRPRELLGAELCRAREAAIARALAGETVLFEAQARLDDEPRHYETVISPLRGPQGHVQGAVAASRDVTEKRRLQDQLILSDRLASVGVLAAGLAHELNNPLGAMVTNVALALERVSGLDSDPRAETVIEALADARAAGEHVLGVVKDLGMFSRHDVLQLEDVDVSQVLDSALRMAANEIRHRAQLQRSYGALPSVRANPARLAQAFLNLIVNAAQAIPDGHALDHFIRVSACERDGKVLVEVEDSGEGITPEHMPSIFHPFFSTRAPAVGSGLGLPISRRIVEELGGHISVESKPARGTRVQVLLPAGLPLVPRQHHERRPCGPAAQRGRVLVIDDDEAIGKAVVRTLATDHDVLSLDNAGDALALLEAGERFDVIFCDLMMPVVTGEQFYRKVAERFPRELDRIVFITGGAFTSAARQLLEQVPNARLEKPFELHDLRALVSDRLRN